ncbi:MAG: phospholipid carrier-dependent glycosyltransferase [Defluviitaleaceae bacterium]|nr:phospholipid carrier-dependent glycosyltransferase [Defluviitaleaceae bacterium]
MLVFTAYAFLNIGTLHSPQSAFLGGFDYSIMIDFGEARQIHLLQFMTGVRENQSFALEFSIDGELWSEPFSVRADGPFEVLAWHYQRFYGGDTRFTRITSESYELHIMEIAFRDEYMALIPVSVVSDIGHELFDEQHLIPIQTRDFIHSAYFDEVFYPRTAYEFIHRMEPDEWTHPPLGKVMISWGIYIFGMTPFGWRIVGAMAGVLLLPIIYLFAKALFKESFWAGFATIIFAFDFMHFVQTRIATLDSFVTLFIAAMFYYMYKYSHLNFLTDNFRKTLVPLAFSGFSMGLAVSVKWNGLYGAVGLALLFFIIMAKRYIRHMENPQECRDFYKYTALTFLCCIGFFIIVPGTIYILSYIPYYNTGYLYPELGFFEAVIQNQIDMFNFHMFFDAYHPYTSNWWEWIINRRPVLYFDYVLQSGAVQGISTFGNPIVWWGGIPALVYTFYKAVKRDFVPISLTIGYLSLLLPWIISARDTMFIYYYYPNVVFLSLMITYALKENRMFDKLKINRRVFGIGFAGIAFALFLLFYPVLSGVPISSSYVERFLLWPFMSDWVFIIY